MERIYKIESVLRKSNTIIIIQGNYDRIYNDFNHNNGDGRFLKYTKLKGIAQEGLTIKDLDKCDFLRTFCCFPIFSQRFVDRLSHILKDEVIFYPIEICCENQKKDFYAAKILNYMDVIDHQQTELQAQNDDSSLFSIPPIIANRCLKDFYIARDTKDTYEWFISEKLKNILIKEKFAMKLVNPENKTEQEECRKNNRRTPTLKTGKVSSIKNEATIRSYIDKCLELVQEHKEYLMYVASYEPTIEPEMQDFLDNNLLEGKSPKIYVTQPGRTNYMVDIITEKDHIWKAIDSQISDEDIDKLEGELNVILPLSYKSYLKYKHFYEIFWDIDVFLYPKPIHSWDKILIEENQEMQEEILDEGYFAIGRYSDHGVIVLKLTDDENKEGGVFLFDCETQEVKVLEPTFTEFLNQILHNPKPVLQELKSWEKKMYKME